MTTFTHKDIEIGHLLELLKEAHDRILDLSSRLHISPTSKLMDEIEDLLKRKENENAGNK